LVAVDALPVNAPTNVVEVTDVNPARVVELAPSDIAVVPIVTELLAKLALVIPAVPERLLLVNSLIVFEPAAIVLFVSVSVVARPTSVSVEVGRVKVPVLTIVPMTGLVKVLLVRVCVPVNVATVESIAIVTAVEPLKLVPDKPVPIVSAFVVFAVIVISDEPLNATPLILREVSRVVAVDALPVRAPVNPVEVTEVKPAKVVTVAPRETAVEPIVTELFASLEFEIDEFAKFAKSFLRISKPPAVDPS